MRQTDPFYVREGSGQSVFLISTGAFRDLRCEDSICFSDLRYG